MGPGTTGRGSVRSSFGLRLKPAPGMSRLFELAHDRTRMGEPQREFLDE
jgi:hypothetical protein